MTEITVDMRRWSPLNLQPLSPAHRIDPIAFASALILAPLFIGLLFAWAAMVPVLAIPFGMPLYLLIGLPGFLLLLSRGITRKRYFALAGVGFNLLAAIVLAALFVWPNTHELYVLLIYAALGCIHAALWSAMFCALYHRFRRERFVNINQKGGQK